MLSTFAMLSVNSAKHRDAPTSETLRFAQGDKKRTIPFNDRTTPGDHKGAPLLWTVLTSRFVGIVGAMVSSPWGGVVALKPLWSP